jgi:hypothetical protein
MEIVWSFLIPFIRLMNSAEGNISACNETHSGPEVLDLVLSTSSETPGSTYIRAGSITGAEGIQMIG